MDFFIRTVEIFGRSARVTTERIGGKISGENPGILCGKLFTVIPGEITVGSFVSYPGQNSGLIPLIIS